MNSSIEDDSQHSVDNDAPASSGGVESRRMSPELRALTEHAANRHKEENYRNGKKARAHKEQMKADYAEMIMRTEGREVRPYEKATPERRKVQKKAWKENRSPAQVEKDREADKLRKRAKAKEKKASVQQALEATENYGKF